MSSIPQKVTAFGLAWCASLTMSVRAQDATPQKELVLSFDVTTTVKMLERKQKDNKVIPEETKTSTEKQTIVLGPTYLIKSSGGTDISYLFDKKRVVTKTADKKITNCSLFSIIAFKSMEIKNRMMMREILQKAQLAELKFGEDIDYESMFGVPVPIPGRAETVITTTPTDGGFESYSFNNRKLAAFKAGDPIAPEHEKMFEKFLLYECTLAPAVRKAIMSKHRLPAELSYHVSDPLFREVDVKMTLSDKSERTASSGPLEASGNARCSTEVPLADKSKLPTKEAMTAEVEENKSKKQYLEALLSIFEYFLSTGDDVIEPLIAGMKNEVKDDPRSMVFFAMLAPRSEEEAKQAYATYEKLDKKTLAKSFVLDIFAANLLESFEKPGEAVKLFKKLLAEHPYVTGAYIDLGKLYYGGFDTVTAWECWDQARKISPKHAMLNNVDGIEFALSKEFPEYF